jgi:hypothetical protein
MAGVSVQVTPPAIAPPAVKVTDCELVTVADEGEIVTPGSRLIVADVLFVESAALLAMTITVAGAEKTAGAVYVALSPVETSVPKTGLSDQVTAVFAEPVTVAVNART